jgi:nucleoside recognition membrane protein YjiH
LHPGVTYLTLHLKFEKMTLLHLSFSEIPGYLLPVLLLILIIWSVALVAIANGRFYDNTTKLCWFLIVLCLNVPGVLLFVLWGRKEIQYGNKAENNRT